MHCGIPFILNLQDRAMTELMCGPGDEPLYDRTQEHLGSHRRHGHHRPLASCINAVKRLRDTGDAAAQRRRRRARPGPRRLGAAARGRRLAGPDSKLARSADSGDPLSDDVPLIID